MGKCPSNRFTSPRACSLLGPHPTSVSPSFQVDFVSLERLAKRGRAVSIGVTTQNASTLDLVSPLSHECWWKVGRFRAAYSGLDGSVRAVAGPSPSLLACGLGSTARRKLLAALWATGAGAVRPHVQGGQHGASVCDLEGGKACSNNGSRGPVDHSVGLSN
jgi:hypothetical protein